MTSSIQVAPSPRLPNDYSAAPETVTGDQRSVLAGIHKPKVNLAIWLRRDGPEVDAILHDFPLTHPHDGDAVNTLNIAAPCAPLPIARWVGRLVRKPSAQRAALARDVAELASTFAQITGARRLKIRLERVEHDSCRKFHTDHIGVRLLCTYAGPGTQWIPEEAADRRMLRRGDNDDICLDRDRIESLPRLAVGLFKGDAWPGTEGRGIIHRSPPIAGSGQRRLLLCIDAARAPATCGGRSDADAC